MCPRPPSYYGAVIIPLEFSLGFQCDVMESGCTWEPRIPFALSHLVYQSKYANFSEPYCLMEYDTSAVPVLCSVEVARLRVPAVRGHSPNAHTFSFLPPESLSGVPRLHEMPFRNEF